MVERHIHTEHNQIEEFKDSKFTDFPKNKKTLALIVAGALLASIGGYKLIDTLMDKEKEGIENVQQTKNYKQIIEEFLSLPNTLPNLKGSGKEWQKKREDRYLGKDEKWSNTKLDDRKKVIDGICRMIESGDLEMILRKADEWGVPRECVFLVLAESGWQGGAKSKKSAGGYRQFTEASAKEYGLIDQQGNDYRNDPEKSTDAAMKHLLENYRVISTYNNRYHYNMSETDKWMFAFYLYNCSPKLLRKGLIACKGNINEYAKYQRNNENRNYLPRILAIREVIKEVFKEHGYNIGEVSLAYLNKELFKTEADIMFEDFLHYRDSALVNSQTHKDSTKVNKQSTKMLKGIKSKYQEEYDNGLISKKYLKGANDVIDKEIASIE